MSVRYPSVNVSGQLEIGEQNRDKGSGQLKRETRCYKMGADGGRMIFVVV